MHPTYITDRPADCPICNMKLVPMKDDGAGKRTATDTDTEAEFQCPNHPDFTYHEPGVCDECLTPYKPLNEAAELLLAARVPGRTAIYLTPEKQHLIGARTSVVTNHPLARGIRAPAVLEHDESRLAAIAPRFGGWVMELLVSQTGQEVTQGQPLLTVYSPEVYAAENEYLLAWTRLQSAPDAERAAAQPLLDSARRRLTLWGIGDAEIALLEKSAQPRSEVLLRAPLSGHVITRRVQAGQSFMPGETLFEIGALDPLWVRASVADTDLPFIKVGDPAQVILPTLGGLSLTSRVDFIYPHLEPMTRRAQIRLIVANPELRLRPEQWAEVVIQAGIGEVLAVPASAVIDTGTRYVAFTLDQDQHFAPRQLRIGLKTDEYWQVLGGLREGERVVTRALFLVDAESQLKAALAGMGAEIGHGDTGTR